ncbi:MAG: N-acetylneuraminate synthase family protein [Anaerolineaceae bacterium]|nr:MAG: N-acetylneuraminate synthase family protein [Anaerolineaceae bacterium]
MFEIDGRKVGTGHRCLIFGEVAQAHDGSLGMAHAFIDAIAEAGADGVKFQTHIADAESTPAEPFRVRFSDQDATRYDYWKRMEFTEEQWSGLAQHARKVGLIFLSSPFSVEAVDLLQRVGVPAWKIPSGEVGSTPMFERIAKTKLPILLSTGMSPWSEIDTAMEWIKSEGLPFLVYQCTTAYPCPPEQIGLNLLDAFRKRYECPVGLSDHSGVIFPGLAAAALGVDMLEVHVTLSKEMFGPDVSASLTTDELRQLVEGVRFIEMIQDNPVDKDALAEEMFPLRQTFTKSVVARSDLPEGTILERDHLTIKKPGTGIPADQLGSVIGRRLSRAVKKDELIHEEDLV